MCVAYHQMCSTIKGSLRSPLDGNKVNEISRLILTAEARIVKVIDYDFNFPLPHPYLKHYADIFYPDSPSVYNFSLAILNDLIGSKMPLLFHGRTIALTSLLLGANYLQIPPLSDQRMDRSEHWLQLKKNQARFLIDEEEYYKQKSNEEYMRLEWVKRIHPDLSIEEIKGDFVDNLLESIVYANEVYELHLTSLKSSS